MHSASELGQLPGDQFLEIVNNKDAFEAAIREAPVWAGPLARYEPS